MFQQKYLEYKKKYVDLKNTIKLSGGSSSKRRYLLTALGKDDKKHTLASPSYWFVMEPKEGLIPADILSELSSENTIEMKFILPDNSQKLFQGKIVAKNLAERLLRVTWSDGQTTVVDGKILYYIQVRATNIRLINLFKKYKKKVMVDATTHPFFGEWIFADSSELI